MPSAGFSSSCLSSGSRMIEGLSGRSLEIAVAPGRVGMLCLSLSSYSLGKTGRCF
jgi:hypothetical protein